MSNLDKRSIIYCLPFVSIESEMSFNGFTLKPLKDVAKDENLFTLLEGMPFNNRVGVVIETTNFRSGDLYDPKIDEYIHCLLEVIKFSLFITSPPENQDPRGFFCAESFEVFKILQKRNNLPMLNFEHKVVVSNGMSNFSFSLENYYKTRANYLYGFVAKLHKSDLVLTDRFIKYIDNKDAVHIIQLYNKCWSLDSLHDYFNKAVYARMSVEVFIEKVESLKKKTYVNVFIKKVVDLINKSTSIHKGIYDLYKDKIELEIKEIELRLENYLKELTDARHCIVHEGIYLNEFRNIPPYLLFFPMFFVVFFNDDELTDDIVYRLIFLLGLFTYDFSRLNEINLDEKTMHMKYSPICTYLNYSRIFYKSINNSNYEYVNVLVVAISNWLDDAKKR